MDSSKIVSLHMEKCSLACPNSNVCYHKRKGLSLEGGPLPRFFRKEMLEEGFTLHDSVCSGVTDEQYELLKNYDNYNITMPATNYLEEKGRLHECWPRLQVTVWDPRILSEEEIQKLFLVSERSLLLQLMSIKRSQVIRNLHVVFDADFVRETNVFNLIALAGRGITLDSCLWSWFINGCCPYEHNYIDITFDGTLRKCPFNYRGTDIPKDYFKNEGTYLGLFKLGAEAEECVYKEIFNRRKNGRTLRYPSVQYNSTDN